MTVTVLHLDTYRDGGWLDTSRGGWADPLVRSLRTAPTEELVAEALADGLYVAVARVESGPENARSLTQNPGGPLPGWSKQSKNGVTVFGRGFFEIDHGDEHNPQLAYRRTWNGDLIVDGDRLHMVAGERTVEISLPAPDLSSISEIGGEEDARGPRP